jgi:O-antigen/teichoic acid export membrane protein
MVRFFSGASWDRGTSGLARRALLMGASGGLAVSLLVMIFAGDLNAFLLRWPLGESLFRSGALLIGVSSMEAIVLDLLRARGRLIGYSGYQAGQAIVTLGSLIVAIPLGLGLVGLVRLLVIARATLLVGPLLRALSVGSVNRAGPEPLDQTVTLPRMLRFGMPLVVVGMGLWMIHFGDRLVVGRFLSATDLGLYAAAYALATVVLGAGAPIHLPAYPRIVEAVQRGPGALRGEIQTVHRFLNLSVIPAAVFLALGASDLLRLLGGEAFSIGVLIPVALIVAMGLDQWNGLAHYVLLSFDRTRWLQGAWLVAGLANVAASWVVVPRWGLSGAAVTTLVTFVLLEAAIFRQASRHVSVLQAYRWGHAGRTTFAVLMAGLLAQPLLNADAPLRGVLTSAAVFTAVFAAVGFAARAITRDDLQKVGEALGS